MAGKAFSYPYPVLGNADDIDTGTCSLQVESVAFNTASVKLQFTELRTGNTTIDTLLNDGDAHWVVQLRCGLTYFREAYRLMGEKSAGIALPADDVLGNVEVETYIVSNTAIQDYAPEGMHSDYSGCFFQIEAGATLGRGIEFKFAVDPGFDPMRDSIASIVNITIGDFTDGPFEVNWQEENIQIYLSKNDWALYPAARNNASSILHSALVLPVLSEAISKLSDADYQDNRWATRLSSLLTVKDISTENSLRAAQLILSSPFNRVLEQIQSEMDGDGE